MLRSRLTIHQTSTTYLTTTTYNSLISYQQHHITITTTLNNINMCNATQWHDTMHVVPIHHHYTIRYHEPDSHWNPDKLCNAPSEPQTLSQQRLPRSPDELSTLHGLPLTHLHTMQMMHVTLTWCNQIDNTTTTTLTQRSTMWGTLTVIPLRITYNIISSSIRQVHYFST